MTSLKHYHLGCGESLQSNWTELQRLLKTTEIAKGKSQLKKKRNSKSGKQH